MIIYRDFSIPSVPYQNFKTDFTDHGVSIPFYANLSSNVRLFVLGGFAFFFIFIILFYIYFLLFFYNLLLYYCLYYYIFFISVTFNTSNVVASKNSLLWLTLSNLPNVVDCLLACSVHACVCVCARCKRGECSSEAWMTVCHSVWEHPPPFELACHKFKYKNYLSLRIAWIRNRGDLDHLPSFASLSTQTNTYSVHTVFYCMPRLLPSTKIPRILFWPCFRFLLPWILLNFFATTHYQMFRLHTRSRKRSHSLANLI